MARRVKSYLAGLIHLYHELTGKTYMEMALDFDITLSNLYLYRNEQGNPTAETIDKIIDAVERNCPEAIQRMNSGEEYQYGRRSDKSA